MAKESKDWLEWHEPYQDPTSALSRRLEVVQQQIRLLLPRQLEQPFKVISICAGQGDDILGVLETYDPRDFVHARLVEIDERNVDAAREHVNSLGLRHIQVVLGDAALLSAYEDAVPADIILACGVFGNISDEDIFNTIDALPQLCKSGTTVIWTRSRRAPDITPRIREYFVNHRFPELDFIAPDDVKFSVGVNRFEGHPQPLEAGEKMFTFIV